MGLRPETDSEHRAAGLDFEVAHRRHVDAVYRFCLSRSGNPTVAQEISQKVFTEAWNRWGEISSPTRPIAPWLFGVARHMLSSQQRDRRRKDNLVRALGELQPDHAGDPSEELARTHTARVLVGSMRSLPAGQRDVVGLCLLSDCTYETAAAVLQIPVGTVRSRLARARTHLALAVRAADVM